MRQIETLVEEFPFIKEYGLSEYDVGPGWLQLLYNLCKEITNAFESEGLESDIKVDQIKEKFGSLRFYYSFKHEHDLSDAEKRVRKRIEEIVDAYEDRSLTICEICGRAGVLRSDLNWNQTLCRDCYEKALEKQE